MYSIQHYVIKFVSDLWQGQWFSPGTLVSSTNKTDRHDLPEILLKVALNPIAQPIPVYSSLSYLYIQADYLDCCSLSISIHNSFFFWKIDSFSGGILFWQCNRATKNYSFMVIFKATCPIHRNISITGDMYSLTMLISLVYYHTVVNFPWFNRTN